DVDTMLSIYTIPALFMLNNIKHISWEHFNYNVTLGKKIRIPIRNMAAKFSDIVITLTERDKSLWIKYTKGKNIIAIPNPITLQGKIPRLNINKKKCILAVGRLTHQKGFDMLIHSWKVVNQQYPDWCLKIIGSGEDEYNLISLINTLKLDNSVEIAPNTHQIETEYYSSSYLVLSSRYEGFGLVILEAQACGLPVISFDCDAGPSEIIKNNISGWLCECENTNELALKIINAINIFDKNPEFYKELEKNSIINSKQFEVENILPLWTKIL
ncbi:glycosyltransferase, partial [Providencia rettgeri]|nr:glycosyltransferase [Providencia rettgeri]